MNDTVARFEMPIWDPCPFCELAAGRIENRHIINATSFGDLSVSVQTGVSKNSENV